jgi:RNA polymerase sigma factor (sigma-70 family)
MSSVTPPRPARVPRKGSADWHERSARLFEDLRRPAAAMVRRAFGSAFTDYEIEDIYANAWVGTLRALEPRHSKLDDEEIRRYLLTAVAHQASKELRRRRRRPVASLEKAGAVADATSGPDEQADRSEQSRVTRDLLSSLPRRRRAVLMLRYGWGLEPRQVCELIEGLSPRAYRKEITKGIDQLTERIRVLERGDWCAEREPILKAYAAGIADPEQQRQAQHHLAHCRHCADFVGKLSGHLHDLGSSLVVPGAVDIAANGRLSLAEHVSGLADRARDLVAGVFAKGGSHEALPSVAPRGGGAAATGALAKLVGLEAAGKAAVACLGGSAAAAICVAAGIGPALPQQEPGSTTEARTKAAHVGEQPRRLGGILPSQVGTTDPPPPSTGTPEPTLAPSQEASAEPVESTQPTPAPAPPPSAPAQQFGLAPASSPSQSGSAASLGGEGPTLAESAAQEFGP